MTAAPPDIRVELVSDPAYLSGAREMISAVARRLGFSEEGCGQIALAVDEALCNVMRHGYDRPRAGPIWISIWPRASDNGDAGITIVIEDEARQVDEEQIKGRDLDEVRPGGLGVHIIRQVMDVVRYEKRRPGGMRLTLAKRRDGVNHPCACGGPGACGGT